MNEDAVIKPASRIVIKLINKMEIKCKYCGEVMKIEQVTEHEQACKKPKCANPLCKKIFHDPTAIRIPIKNHVNKYACSGICKYTATFHYEISSNEKSSILEIFHSLISRIKLEQQEALQGKYDSLETPQIAEEEKEEGPKELLMLDKLLPEGIGILPREDQSEGHKSTKLTQSTGSGASAFFLPSQHDCPVVFTWDKENSSPAISLSKDIRSASLYESEYQYRNMYGNYGFKSGIHYWEIIIDSRSQNEIKLGVASELRPYSGSAFCDFKTGWGFYGLGELRHNNDSSGVKYGRKFRKNGIVGVCLNMINGTLSFALNGECFGAAFKDPALMQGRIYPAVALLRISGCILVSGKSVPEYFINI
jgi:hypothetical protein